MPQLPESQPTKTEPESTLSNPPSPSKKKRRLARESGGSWAPDRPDLYPLCLAKWRLKPADIERQPKITAVLAQAAGGLKAVVEAMRFSQDPLIVEFLRVYDDSAEADRKNMPFEAFAVIAKIDATALLGAIIMCIREHSVNVVKIIAMTGHPLSMQARVRSARTLGGIRDRDALDRGLGFLPAPKGPTFINRVSLTQGEAEELEEGAEPDVNFLFPTLSDTQKKLSAGKRE